MAEKIGNADFREKVVGSSGLSLVEFYSDACVPCKRMSPILTALGEQYSGDVYIAKVDAPYERELTEKYGITATPTFLLFKNGDVVERFTGARKKEELEQLIEANK